MTDRDDVPFTLRAAAGLPPGYGPMNDAVLIVIDAQMEYTEGGALTLPVLQPALDNITALLLTGRKDGAKIVHIAHEGSEGRAFDPAKGGRIIEQVAPLDGETVSSFAFEIEGGTAAADVAKAWVAANSDRVDGWLGL